MSNWTQNQVPEIMINHTSISKDMSDFVNNLLFLLSEALEQGGFNSDNQ